MVELNQVNKSLGNFQLKNISFQFPKGYIMGLAGANGSGKTSLIYMLLGLYTADSGHISILDSDYDTNEAGIKDKIGFVLQEDLFYMQESLIKNGMFFGKKYHDFQSEKLHEYFRRFGLDSKKRYGRLSKGEKLKFQLAFALSHNPQLLILDEATGNFDLAFRTEFQKLMTAFIADGEHSIILSSHVYDEMERIADYLLFMDHGEAVLFMDREAIANEYRLVSGERYKIKNLSRDHIIYCEENQFETKALVKYSRFDTYDKGLTVKNVSMSDFIYYYMAGLKADQKGKGRDK